MAAISGKLSSLNITVPNTDQQLYAANASFISTCLVSVTNRNATPIKIRLALTTGTNVTDDSYLAFDQIVYANETYERAGIMVGPGQYIYCRSNTTATSFVVMGVEE